MSHFFKVFLILFVFLCLWVGSITLLTTSYFWSGVLALVALTSFSLACIIKRQQ